MTCINKLIQSIMLLQRWPLACLIMERMVFTMSLAVWWYLSLYDTGRFFVLFGKITFDRIYLTHVISYNYWNTRSKRVLFMHRLCNHYLNRCHVGLFLVDLPTEVRSCWNSQCTLQGLSQQPMMIGPCFNFLNTLPWADEYFCCLSLCLHWKKVFFN